MAYVLMPFLMSMLLGRTIDLQTYEVGSNIYDNALYKQEKLMKFDNIYAVLQEDVFPYGRMHLPIDMVLRIKSNVLSSISGHMGLDGLLRDTTWKQNSAVVVVASSVQTVQKTLKEDASPIEDWQSKISKNQTHYANSIIYGGWAFIIYRFHCDVPGDVQIVRETLTSEIGAQGNLGPDTIKLWRNALSAIKRNPEIRGKVKIDIRTYSNFPFNHDLTSPNGLMRALSKIPKLVGPVGKPLLMELLPLHDLDKKFAKVEENHELDDELLEIDVMYDDVKNAKDSLTKWVENTMATFTEQQEKQISKLLLHLTKLTKNFHNIATKASVYSNMDEKLLQSAASLYRSKLEEESKTYEIMVRALKEEYDAECENDFHHKIKGLLKVDDTERINLGKVEGGLEECKSACLSLEYCRSVGYADSMVGVAKDTSSLPHSYRQVKIYKQCFLYFRSTSTAPVTSPKGAVKAGVYDRKCNY